MTRPVPRRILLVGFMGSGKSSVGPLLAERLGWSFADMDERVVALDGRPISRIFAESGEPVFRGIEARAAEELLARERVVVASGGGWGAVPGRLAGLDPETVSVWLKVSAREAVRRAGEGQEERPLLAGPDPLGAARRLLAERLPHYARCDVEVDTEGRTAEDVTSLIEAVLRDPPWNLSSEHD